jgi:hypothetical protein
MERNILSASEQGRWLSSCPRVLWTFFFLLSRKCSFYQQTSIRGRGRVRAREPTSVEVSYSRQWVTRVEPAPDAGQSQLPRDRWGNQSG